MIDRILTYLKRNFFRVVSGVVVLCFALNIVHLVQFHNDEEGLTGYYKRELRCADKLLENSTSKTIDSLLHTSVLNPYRTNYAARLLGIQDWQFGDCLLNDTLIILKKQSYLLKRRHLYKPTDSPTAKDFQVQQLAVRSLMYDFRRYIINFLTLIGLVTLTTIAYYAYQSKDRDEEDIFIYVYLIIAVLVWAMHAGLRLYQVQTTTTELISSFLNNAFLLFSLPYLWDRIGMEVSWLNRLLRPRFKFLSTESYAFNLAVAAIHLLCACWAINAPEKKDTIDTVLTSCAYAIFGFTIYFVLRKERRLRLLWLLGLGVFTTILANLIKLIDNGTLSKFPILQDDFYYSVTQIIYNSGLFFLILIIYYLISNNNRDKANRNLEKANSDLSETVAKLKGLNSTLGHRVMSDAMIQLEALKNQYKDLEEGGIVDESSIQQFLRRQMLFVRAVSLLHAELNYQGSSQLNPTNYLNQLLRAAPPILGLPEPELRIELGACPPLQLSFMQSVGYLFNALLLHLSQAQTVYALRINLSYQTQPSQIQIGIQYSADMTIGSLCRGDAWAILAGFEGQREEGSLDRVQKFCNIRFPIHH